jgi:hypothetical protein
MAGFVQPLENIALGIGKKMFTRLGKKKLQVENEGTKQAQLAYYSFPKRPVDTAESISQTKMVITLLASTAFMKWTIGTDYANMFRFGLGSNRNYGPRDPLPIGAVNTLNQLTKILR